MALMLDEEMDENVTTIKVIGVGGGGGNAVNRMGVSGLSGVEFVAMNTDQQALLNSKATQKVQLGAKLTKGRGAGADPEIGQRAAEESKDEIANALKGSQMVFITAGMGGGTGTGAAPVVAETAHDLGILTVGIVTKPFSFEGKRKMGLAEQGIANLLMHVDSLIVIPNERLKMISQEKITLMNAFQAADNVLRQGVESISALINVPAFINLDFADVRSIMKDAGYAHMGVGSAKGAGKAENAAKAAISSPLLETSIAGAHGVIINITSSPDIGLEDVETAAGLITQSAHPDANIIWGTAFDENLSDEMRVTVVATGFDNKAAEAAAQKLVEEYGLVVDPAAVVREIGVGLQQRVEILKTLYRGADILILDEPTAVLTPQETDELFAVIRRVVRELGMTVIIITHKLYEVMAISDRVGVMRKGRLIGVENTCNVDEKKLASMMVGRPVLYDRLEKTGEAGAEQIRVSGLTVCDDRGLVAVDGLSLSVRAGEVLGIAAIEGNGQSELLEAITGMRRVERGTVEVCGQNVTGKTAGEIRKVGLSHIPEDRLATGVSRSASVTDNLLMGKQRDKAFSGFAFHQRRSSIERYAEEVYERFDIRGAGIDTAVGSMSGGNMQKVVVAREFSFDSPVLIIAQPTRGVDVGAIEFIHTRIIEKRNAGCAILLCSADLDEVFRLSDRIITMYEGRNAGEFRTSDITKEEIGWYMTGHREGKEAAKT